MAASKQCVPVKQTKDGAHGEAQASKEAAIHDPGNAQGRLTEQLLLGSPVVDKAASWLVV